MAEIAPCGRGITGAFVVPRVRAVDGGIVVARVRAEVRDELTRAVLSVGWIWGVEIVSGGPGCGEGGGAAGEGVVGRSPIEWPTDDSDRKVVTVSGAEDAAKVRAALLERAIDHRTACAVTRPHDRSFGVSRRGCASPSSRANSRR
jgi:hypothetical protein